MCVHEHSEQDSDVQRFDRWSRRYDRSLLQPLFFRRVHRMVQAALSPTHEESVLDVGCGTGALASRLARKSGGRVIGVDPAPGMIAVAVARSGSQVSFGVAAAEGLPFAEGAFDAAVSAVSAHHWRDPRAGFRELHRVVRPGGRVIVADVGAPGSLVGLLRRMSRPETGHHRGWSQLELGDLLYGAGFHSVTARSHRIMGSDIVTLAARR